MKRCLHTALTRDSSVCLWSGAARCLAAAASKAVSAMLAWLGKPEDACVLEQYNFCAPLSSPAINTWPGLCGCAPAHDLLLLCINHACHQQQHRVQCVFATSGCTSALSSVTTWGPINHWPTAYDIDTHIADAVCQADCCLLLAVVHASYDRVELLLWQRCQSDFIAGGFCHRAQW